MLAKIYGGNLEGTYDVEELWKFSTGKSKDFSEYRGKGGCVPRKELDNQPILPGYCGPMWDGDGLRYDTPEIYNLLST